MQTQWLIQTKKDKLLLFVNGWGMDAAPFSFLSSDMYDVLMLYHYVSLTPPPDFQSMLAGYREIYVVAWSLGVWICQRIKDLLPDRTVYSMAVNGTLQPIHARYGIAPEIFDHTLKKLTPQSSQRFYMNMFLDDNHARRFLGQQPKRHFESLRDELAVLQKAILETTDDEYMGFDTAVISSFDIIIPSKNQMRFWKNQSTCRFIKSGHFPFYLWNRWEDLLVYISHE